MPSMMPYRDPGKPLREMAAELSAGAVLVVSVQRFGDEVRVTLWAAHYSRDADNTLETQRELARIMVEELEVYRRQRE